jgi:hypothetical protein
MLGSVRRQVNEDGFTETDLYFVLIDAFPICVVQTCLCAQPWVRVSVKLIFAARPCTKLQSGDRLPTCERDSVFRFSRRPGRRIQRHPRSVWPNLLAWLKLIACPLYFCTPVFVKRWRRRRSGDRHKIDCLANVQGKARKEEDRLEQARGL